MWDKIWLSIKHKSVIQYKSSPQATKNDMVRVELEMPIEIYKYFLQQIEVPHALRGRRKDDSHEKRQG